MSTTGVAKAMLRAAKLAQIPNEARSESDKAVLTLAAEVRKLHGRLEAITQEVRRIEAGA